MPTAYKATFAALAALAFAVPAVAQSDADYRDSVRCASLHIIAGQVLAQDPDRGASYADLQADKAAKYVDFAQAIRPGLTADTLDADLIAQMDRDVAAITGPNGDVEAFLKDRKALCDKLDTKI